MGKKSKLPPITITNPDVVLEWDYDKNDSVPNEFTRGSHKKIWWICPKGHEYEAKISSRCSQFRTKCAYCSNKLACSDNCLATMHPEIAREWDYSKNSKKPTDVLPHSNLKVWWICGNGHSFNTWLSDRVDGRTRCTRCLGYTVRNRKVIHANEGYIVCRSCEQKLDLGNFRLRIDLRDHTKRYDTLCKKCSNEQIETYRKTDEGIAAEIVRRLKHVCKVQKFDFDLDKKWVLDRLNSIEWKCELTRIPFELSRNSIGKKSGFRWRSLSVDRLVAGGGYTKNNIRFILNQVNVFRQDQSDAHMYMIAKSLLDGSKKENIDYEI